MKRTFTGFLALEHHTGSPRSWRDVLDYFGDDYGACEMQYKKLPSVYHPDKGGDPGKFSELNAAWEKAKLEFGVE